ncbi:MAG: chemotaxis protein CheX [Desulfovibrionaceae bacterium]|jgi:chemotaxis protein CheX|nr:chemotaxis protein CheX [Desulfovibrionaceae bacterium]
MSRYDVRYINPFLLAVVDVLGTMAMVQATPGKPYINTARTSTGDVTGLIGITGHARGVISLSLDEKCILAIVSNMLGESFTKINEDIVDAVGELTNMIAGQARVHLANDGLNFQASTPSVITGKNHTLNHISKQPILSIPFTTPDGNLVVEISLSDNE